jgi:hypothetical protein
MVTLTGWQLVMQLATPTATRRATPTAARTPGEEQT